jgi:hypothetical protein
MVFEHVRDSPPVVLSLARRKQHLNQKGRMSINGKSNFDPYSDVCDAFVGGRCPRRTRWWIARVPG